MKNLSTLVSRSISSCFLANCTNEISSTAHKNVKAFITHSGFFGVQEAIYEGKPLVMIPFYYDQPGTAAIMQQKGVGRLLDHQTLTEEKLLNVIGDVIEDKKYSEAMQNFSRVYKDRPNSPKEDLIYWTEYVIRHNGAGHLRTVATDMPFHQYFLLDISLFVILVFSAFFFIIYFISKYFYRLGLRKLKLSEAPAQKKNN